MLHVFRGETNGNCCSLLKYERTELTLVLVTHGEGVKARDALGLCPESKLQELHADTPKKGKK